MRAYRISGWVVMMSAAAFAACGRDVPQTKNPATTPQSTSAGSTGGSTGGATGATTGSATGGTTGRRPGTSGGSTGMTNGSTNGSSTASTNGGSNGATTGGTTGSTDPFTGTITALRDAGRAKGTQVVIPQAVLIAARGNLKHLFFADAAGGEGAVIRAEMCTTGAECKFDAAPALGTNFSLEGTLDVFSNGKTISIKLTKLTNLASQSSVPRTEVPATTLVNGAAGNADKLGTYVLLNKTATVSSVTSEAMLNSAYTPAMETDCVTNKKQCCAKGPKYAGFEVTVDGQTLLVASEHYKATKNPEGTELDAWPCNGDFTKAVKVGDTLPMLAGVFDVDAMSTRAQIMPTRKADYGAEGGTTGGSTGGSTGTTTGTTGGTTGTTGGSTGTTGGTTGTTGGTSGTTTGTTGGTTGTTTGTTGGTTGTTTGTTGGTTGTTTGGNPYAPYCQACTTDADCGENPLEFCIADDLGHGICGNACRFDSDCAPTAYCASIFGTDANGNDVYLWDNCYPRSGRCE